jgi:hypothetical protein
VLVEPPVALADDVAPPVEPVARAPPVPMVVVVTADVVDAVEPPDPAVGEPDESSLLHAPTTERTKNNAKELRMEFMGSLKVASDVPVGGGIRGRRQLNNRKERAVCWRSSPAPARLPTVEQDRMPLT